jgi:hypothetical protein
MGTPAEPGNPLSRQAERVALRGSPPGCSPSRFDDRQRRTNRVGTLGGERPLHSVEWDGSGDFRQARLDLCRGRLASLCAEPGAGQTRGDAGAPERPFEVVAEIE